MTPLRQVLTSAGVGVVGAVLTAEALVRCGGPRAAPDEPTGPSAPTVVVPSDAPAADAADAGDAARTLDSIDDAVTELERAVDTGAQEDGQG